MNYIDLIMTIIQSMFFVYFVNYCLEYQKKITNRLIVFGILLSCIGYFIPDILWNLSVSVFATHILGMIIVALFFSKKPTEALIAFNLMYSAMVSWIFIFGNILYGFLQQSILKEHMDVLNIIFTYVLQVILYIFLIKKMNSLKQIFRILSVQNLSSYYVIMVSFVLDFLLSFYSITYKNESPFFVYTIIILLVVFIVTSIISFIKIKERANKIFGLNRTLEIKNSELRKIKNSYGTQMSALYQLCAMERYNDLKGLLKSIINEASNPGTVNDNNQKQGSILSYATRHIQSDDINVIINEEANLALLAISEMELYRIVVNIVNNAVKAMKGKGTLTISSYYKDENVIIEIENDGEMIPEENLEKIFQSGFTTKNNNDRGHGYGLSIVKELIESYQGKIFVESSESSTKFTIDLPVEKLDVS